MTTEQIQKKAVSHIQVNIKAINRLSARAMEIGELDTNVRQNIQKLERVKSKIIVRTKYLHAYCDAIKAFASGQGEEIIEELAGAIASIPIADDGYWSMTGIDINAEGGSTDEENNEQQEPSS